MKLLRDLYLTDRFFYVLGGNIFLFFLSFLLNPVFYAGLVLLALSAVALLADIFILFSGIKVSADRIVPPVLSLGERNKVSIELDNLSALGLKLRIIDEIPYQFNERDFSLSMVLGKSKKEVINYFLQPQVRGEYRFDNINVFVKTVIGLAAKREVTRCEKRIAVYPSVPQMIRQEAIAVNHISFTAGERKNRKIERSYEFDQIKMYIPGDDTRNINWKATSTLSELMVNHYEDERSQQIYSVIDKSRVMKMPFDGLTLVDHAINATLAFSNIVLKKQDKAGLLIFSKKTDTFIKAEKGTRHLKRILHSLYKEKYDYSEANYEALYAKIRRSISNRSLLFLYTNFDSVHSLERSISILRMINRFHLLVVVFFDNTELDAYSKTGARTILDIYQRTIAKKFLLEKELIIKELRKHGIHALKCSPAQLSTDTINKYLDLKARGLV